MELGMLANLLVAFTVTTVWATRPIPTAARPATTVTVRPSATR